jgi:hypothetical protein
MDRLSQCRFSTVRLGDKLDLASVNTSKETGDFTISILAKAVDTDDVASVVVSSWLDKAGQFILRSSTSSVPIQ